MLRIAHLVVWPDMEAEKHKVVLETATVSITMVGNRNLDEAVGTAKRLVEEEGIQLIELCGAFGPVGNAKIIEGVGGKVPVASVNYGLEVAAQALPLLEE